MQRLRPFTQQPDLFLAAIKKEVKTDNLELVQLT